MRRRRLRDERFVHTARRGGDRVEMGAGGNGAALRRGSRVRAARAVRRARRGAFRAGRRAAACGAGRGMARLRQRNGRTRSPADGRAGRARRGRAARGPCARRIVRPGARRHSAAERHAGRRIPARAEIDRHAPCHAAPRGRRVSRRANGHTCFRHSHSRGAASRQSLRGFHARSRLRRALARKERAGRIRLPAGWTRSRSAACG